MSEYESKRETVRSVRTSACCSQAAAAVSRKSVNAISLSFVPFRVQVKLGATWCDFIRVDHGTRVTGQEGAILALVKTEQVE